MCGIVGFWDKNEGYDKPKVLKAMADKIVHRGPDSDGYFLEGAAALGFRRLAIIDLAGGGQPIFNEDKSKVITFNGEIYNFRSLRAELESLGHVFSTHADTEVVLHGYEQWGKEVTRRLRGMFTFVIYDRKAGTLFGARDGFGIKPFYYYKKDGVFLYGSEIKSFLAHPKFVRRFQEKWLPTYLNFEYIPNEETLFENVYKLPAGCCFTLSKEGEVKIEAYFTPEYHIDESKSLEEWEDIIEETFRGSCRAHCISDVKVGCFLSSGVDSSYVTRFLRDDMPVKAFSIGYAEQRYSELAHAKELAEKIGVECVTREITARDFFDAVPQVQYHMDEPLPNPSAIPLYYLTQMAAEHVKVVLSGEGADELFGGYNQYAESLTFERYMKLPRALRAAAGGVAAKLPDFHGKRFLTRGRYDLPQRYFRMNYNFHYDEMDTYLKGGWDKTRPEALVKPYFDAVAGDELTRMQYVDMKTWLQYDILQKADKMAMAASLELRVPFLDREVLDVALSIPAKYRVEKGMTKVALRKAAGRVLPEKSAKMPKIGFITPLNDWMRQEEFYHRMRDTFQSADAEKFFHVPALLELLDRHQAGQNGTMKRLWSVYSFLNWYDQFFHCPCANEG